MQRNKEDLMLNELINYDTFEDFVRRNYPQKPFMYMGLQINLEIKDTGILLICNDRYDDVLVKGIPQRVKLHITIHSNRLDLDEGLRGTSHIRFTNSNSRRIEYELQPSGHVIAKYGDAKGYFTHEHYYDGLQYRRECLLSILNTFLTDYYQHFGRGGLSKKSIEFLLASGSIVDTRPRPPPPPPPPSFAGGYSQKLAKYQNKLKLLKN